MELYLAHLADLDPKWNVDGNISTSRTTSMRPSTPPSPTRGARGALRAVLTDKAAAARYQQEIDKGDGRFTTADVDDALAPAEALQKRVSRLRELFAEPGGDAALFSALADWNPSWPRTADPTDIEWATGVASRSLGRRQPANWQHRVVLEAEQQFPDVPAAAWRRTGERFDGFTDTGRPRQAHHADAFGPRPRARHRRRAARAAGAAGPGEAALRVGARARADDAPQASPFAKAAHHRDRDPPGGDVQPRMPPRRPSESGARPAS